MRYVGRLVSAHGVRIDPKDLAAVQALRDRTPNTAGDVRKLVRFLSYYRAFVQDIARIAKPLYDLPPTSQGKPCHPAATESYKEERRPVVLKNSYTVDQNIKRSLII